MKPRQRRPGDRLGDGFGASEIAEIGKRRVGAVQAAQLHVLERPHILDQFDPDAAEVRPRAIDETILDYPLAERFVHHRRGVEDAGALRQPLDIGLGRRRHDAVDHRTRERTFGRDPAGEFRIHASGQLQHDAAQHVPVFRQVVAAQHGEGTDTRLATAIERPAEEARRGDGAVRVGKILDDVGVGEIKLAGGRRMAIALLCHRQRNDFRLRIGHGGEHGLRVFRRDEHGDQRRADAQRLAFGPQFADRIGIVLRSQSVAQIRMAQADAETPQSPPDFAIASSV